MIAGCGWACAFLLGVVVLRLRRRLELVARAEHELRGPLTAFGLCLDAARRTPAGRRLGVVLDAELARARVALDDLAAARRGRRAASAVAEDVRVDRLVRSSAAAWEPGARVGGRRVRVRFEAGAAVVRGDRRRLAQALGNVMANAVEHGSGDVAVRGVRADDRVRIEVSNAVGADGAGRAGGPAAGGGSGAAGVLAARGGSAAPSGSGAPPGSAAPPGLLGFGDRRDRRGRGLEIAADAAADVGGTLTTGVGERRAVTILDLPVEP